MGVLRSIGRVLFYSEIRAYESLKGARGRIAGAAAAAGERVRRQRQAQAPSYAAELERLTPAQKFAFLYEKLHWSEAELRQQRVTLRRSRRVLLALSVVFAAAFVFTLLRAPWGLALLVIWALGFACVKMLLSVFQLALFEAQIEKRTILEARDFLGLRDFWWRLLR